MFKTLKRFFNMMTAPREVREGLQRAMREEELHPLRLAAEQGDVDKQYSLGIIYHEGVIVERDYDESLRWNRLAAEQGHAGGQYNLGLTYRKGFGVACDYDEALRWYLLAAKQGHVESQNALSGMYYKGEGMARDYREAYIWLLVALMGGKLSGEKEMSAKTLMTLISIELSPADIKAAEHVAKQWFAEIEKRKK